MEERKNKKIDPNLDDIETLQQLPGVGPKLAQLIQESRPYASAEDLQKVSGLGSVVIERWKDLLIFPASDEPAQAAPILAEETAPTSAESQILAADSVPLAVESQSQAEGSVLTSVEGQEQAGETGIAAGENQQTSQEEPNLEAVTEPAMEVTEEQGGEINIPAAPKEQPTVFEPPPAPPLPSGWISRSQAVWGMVITGFAAIILAVAVSLGILAGMNGGLLQFAAPSQVAALTTQAKGLETRVIALEQDTQGLRTRLDNLEGLGSRISIVENTTSDMQNQMKSVTAQVDTIKEEMGGLQTQIDAVKKLGQQFSNFLESLQSLLNDILPLTGGNR